MKINLKTYAKSISFYRRLAMILMLILIIIRPTLSTEQSEREMTNLNVWFVADATGSMVAKDVDKGAKRRFEMVGDDIETIVKKIPGAKYSLLVQDYASYIAAPMTNSGDAIIAAKPYLKPKNSLYSKPSNLTELLQYANTRIAKYKERYPERNNVLVFASDGEDVSGSEITIPNQMDSLVDGVVVLGYGSTSGSLIEEIVSNYSNEGNDYNSISPNRYVVYYGKDPNITTDSQHQVISKINESNLERIASSLGGEYFHRESGEIPSESIDRLTNSASLVASGSDTPVSSGSDIYWVFAIILVLLLLWEGEEMLNRFLTERKS